MKENSDIIKTPELILKELQTTAGEKGETGHTTVAWIIFMGNGKEKAAKETFFKTIFIFTSL